MASSFCKPSRDNHHSLIKTTKYTSKPTLLLKDYLRDDLSSCSSSGFKAFPRRQCCSAVGFHLQKDLQLRRKKRNTTVTALQRASITVITVIKSLSLSNAKTKKGSTVVLSRSFSRKFLSRRFWRKATKKEGSCRRSFRELLMQERDYKPTSFDEDRTTVSSGCCGNSWGESEFTFSSNATSSDCSTENELVDGGKDGVPHKQKIDGVTIGDWSNEKEQFSPVSILDCPFEDEEEMKSHSMITSFFKGADQKHMRKSRHFESIASIEPLVLEKRIKCLELEDEPNNPSTKQCSLSIPIMRNNNEEDALDLLSFVQMSIPFNCLMINTENLLFDYFKQNIEENNDVDISKKVKLCSVAEDWIKGQPQEPYLSWEVKEGRHVYISEMDKCGEWKNFDQETEQLVIKLENEVLTSLVNEIFIDLLI